MPRNLTALFVSLTVLLGGSGCNGSTATVSGAVTFEGQPVDVGQIEFIPADGKGQSASAPITKGLYTISGVQPGTKIAQITAYKKAQAVKSVQEFADAAKAGETTESGAIIPADAEGNGSNVEIAVGSQTLDFKLTRKPAGAP